MPPDVAQTSRPQHRIGDGVQQHIGVGMAQQPRCMGDLDAPQNQLAAWHQRVHVPTFTYTDVHVRPFKTASANAKSAG